MARLSLMIPTQSTRYWWNFKDLWAEMSIDSNMLIASSYPPH
jgi:hypothetical protein